MNIPNFSLVPLDANQLRACIKETVQEALTEHGADACSPREEILSIKEAAALLKLSVKTVYLKIQGREIPHYKKSNRLYFLHTELIEWIKTGRQKTKEEIQAEALQHLARKRA